MSDSGTSRVITEALGGSPLSLAVQTGRLPAEIRLWRPSSPQEWSEHASRVRAGLDDAWLERIRAALNPGGAAAKRLDRVAAERGIVVTTGQQPGLFGGPVYTLSKALSALALADSLEKQLGVPVA